MQLARAVACMPPTASSTITVLALPCRLNPLMRILAVRPVSTQVDIAYRPVHMQPLDSEMMYIPPKARTY